MLDNGATLENLNRCASQMLDDFNARGKKISRPSKRLEQTHIQQSKDRNATATSSRVPGVERKPQAVEPATASTHVRQKSSPVNSRGTLAKHHHPTISTKRPKAADPSPSSLFSPSRESKVEAGEAPTTRVLDRVVIPPYRPGDSSTRPSSSPLSSSPSTTTSSKGRDSKSSSGRLRSVTSSDRKLYVSKVHQSSHKHPSLHTTTASDRVKNVPSNDSVEPELRHRQRCRTFEEFHSDLQHLSTASPGSAGSSPRTTDTIRSGDVDADVEECLREYQKLASQQAKQERRDKRKIDKKKLEKDAMEDETRAAEQKAERTRAKKQKKQERLAQKRQHEQSRMSIPLSGNQYRPPPLRDQALPDYTEPGRLTTAEAESPVCPPPVAKSLTGSSKPSKSSKNPVCPAPSTLPCMLMCV